MKSKAAFAFLLSAFPLCLTSCGGGEPLSRKDYSSEAIQSESTSMEQHCVHDLQPSEYAKFPEYYLAKFSSFASFKSETHGSTKAKVLFIETTQSIDVMLIKSDYSYLLNESHSSIVNTTHEAYFHDQEALHRNDQNASFEKCFVREYMDIYGVYPFDQAIEGYDVSSGCIRSIEKTGESDGVYTFKFVFDPEKASNNVRIQMKKFGGLDDYPSFSSIELSVSVLDDYTPKSIHLDSYYKAKKIVETDCHQEYDVTFSSFNQSIEVPNLSKVLEEYKF